MARDAREQQKGGAGPIARARTGKVDRDRNPRRPSSAPAGEPVAHDEVRERISRERDAAVAALRRLDDGAEREARPVGPPTDSVLDEGDEAQASEHHEMRGVQRERLAARIRRLTRALERLGRGTYEVCEVCGKAIAPERLAALPEVTTCRDCQERLEREAA